METTNLSTGNGSDKISDKMSATGTAAKGMYNEAKGSAQRVGATLRAELSNLKNDLDALMTRAPGLSDDELNQGYTQLMTKFSSMRHAAKGLASEAGRQINRGVDTTTEYVKDKPMQSLAVAAGTGLLLGLLFKRR